MNFDQEIKKQLKKQQQIIKAKQCLNFFWRIFDEQDEKAT